jgi:hypothetical protein
MPPPVASLMFRFLNRGQSETVFSLPSIRDQLD